MFRTASVLVGAFVAVLVAAWASASCSQAPATAPPPRVPKLIPPLHDAHVGEWLRLENGPWADEFRVVKETDYDVSIEETIFHDGAADRPPVVQTWHRNSFAMPLDGVIQSFERDRIEIRGKWYDCWAVDVRSHDGRRVYWISEDVAVHGVLKQMNIGPKGPDEATALVAADWGAAK